MPAESAGSTTTGGQLTLGLTGFEPFPRKIEPLPREILPGVVHIAGLLTPEEQRALAGEFRRWALPPAGLRHPRMPTGQLMSVQSVCLGWHWQPYGYSRTADDTDGTPVKALIAGVAHRSVGEAFGHHSAEAIDFSPDAAIVNLYAPGAHPGLHVDAEEPSDAPVVTVSLGDTCVFRLGGVARRTGPFIDLHLRSGDLHVFGRENRRIHHGVPRIYPGTAPSGLGLPPGRLSITVRETGFGAPGDLRSSRDDATTDRANVHEAVAGDQPYGRG